MNKFWRQLKITHFLCSMSKLAPGNWLGFQYQYQLWFPSSTAALLHQHNALFYCKSYPMSTDKSAKTLIKEASLAGNEVHHREPQLYTLQSSADCRDPSCDWYIHTTTLASLVQEAWQKESWKTVGARHQKVIVKQSVLNRMHKQDWAIPISMYISVRKEEIFTGFIP